MAGLKYKIEDIIQVEDVTEKYEEGVKLFDPNYKADEPRLQVTLRVTCYGTFDLIKKIWKQSDFEKYKKQGYFEE